MFGLIFILYEIGIKSVMKYFNFLGFFFGKGFFCLFLGLMCFDKHKWFSWACSLLFFISAIFYILLGFTFIKDEKSKFQDIVKETSSSSTPQNNNPVRDVNIQQNQFDNKYKV